MENQLAVPGDGHRYVRQRADETQAIGDIFLDSASDVPVTPTRTINAKRLETAHPVGAGVFARCAIRRERKRHHRQLCGPPRLGVLCVEWKRRERRVAENRREDQPLRHFQLLTQSRTPALMNDALPCLNGVAQIGTLKAETHG